jgi:hypothetical protein
MAARLKDSDISSFADIAGVSKDIATRWLQVSDI